MPLSLRVSLLVVLLSVAVKAQVPIDVVFRMTQLESKVGIPGVPVRLVLGDAPGWQNPQAGSRFVTGSSGEAKFSTTGLVDKRWVMIPYGMTGLSFPRRVDHIRIAAELENLIPKPDSSYERYQWLHVMDIDCYTSSDCATSGITSVYTRDAQGRFTRRGEYLKGDLKMPELGGMLLNGPGYKTSGLFLQANADRSRWKVELTLQKSPPPVRR